MPGQWGLPGSMFCWADEVGDLRREWGGGGGGGGGGEEGECGGKAE